MSSKSGLSSIHHYCQQLFFRWTRKRSRATTPSLRKRYNSNSKLSILTTLLHPRWSGWTRRTSSSARTCRRSTTTSRSSSPTPSLAFRSHKLMSCIYKEDYVIAYNQYQHWNNFENNSCLTQNEIAESCATVKDYCTSNTEDVNNNIIEFKEVNKNNNKNNCQQQQCLVQRGKQ